MSGKDWDFVFGVVVPLIGLAWLIAVMIGATLYTYGVLN